MYVIRGLAGAGKTTLAHSLIANQGVAIAADDCPNRYLEDGSINPDVPHEAAYLWFWEQVGNAAAAGQSPIVLHNTFVRLETINPAIECAKQYGYSVQIVQSEGVVLADGRWAKSTHAVPWELMEKWGGEWEAVPQPPTEDKLPGDVFAAKSISLSAET